MISKEQRNIENWGKLNSKKAKLNSNKALSKPLFYKKILLLKSNVEYLLKTYE